MGGCKFYICNRHNDCYSIFIIIFALVAIGFFRLFAVRFFGFYSLLCGRSFFKYQIADYSYCKYNNTYSPENPGVRAYKKLKRCGGVYKPPCRRKEKIESKKNYQLVAFTHEEAKINAYDKPHNRINVIHNSKPLANTISDLSAVIRR